MNKSIYIDNNSSTICDPKVAIMIHKMLMYNNLCNPHSSEHKCGWKSMDLLDESRKLVASRLEALPEEIFFTSGATESNNIAIKGIIESAVLKKNKKNKIITTNIEHKCVLNAFHEMSNKSGLELVILKVDQEGFISLEDFEEHAEDTLLISVIHTNNEIGVVQNIKEIGRIASKNEVIFHVDASQGIYSDIDVVGQDIDLLSLSSHKFYAPIGCGILFINSLSPIKPMSVYSGGFQQEGVRAGTISPILSYATAHALDLLSIDKPKEIEHLKGLRELFIKLLDQYNIRYKINGSMENRHPGNLNLSLADIENSASFIYKLQPDVCLSSGSACNSGVIEPSYVLRSLGLSVDDAERSIRIGFGRFNTADEIERCVEYMSLAIKD